MLTKKINAGRDTVRKIDLKTKSLYEVPRIKSTCTFNLWLVVFTIILIVGFVPGVVKPVDGYMIQDKRPDNIAALYEKMMKTVSDMGRPRYGRGFDDYRLMPSYQLWKKYQSMVANRGDDYFRNDN